MSKDRRFDSRCKAIKRLKDSSWPPRDRLLFQVAADLPPSCPVTSYFSKFPFTLLVDVSKLAYSKLPIMDSIGDVVRGIEKFNCNIYTTYAVT